jgi:DNA-binding CsgD family transcriptional regulator
MESVLPAGQGRAVSRLSVREREIVELARAGCENKAIACQLGLAYSTVRVLMARAARKLGARTRQEVLQRECELG